VYVQASVLMQMKPEINKMPIKRSSLSPWVSWSKALPGNTHIFKKRSTNVYRSNRKQL